MTRAALLRNPIVIKYNTLPIHGGMAIIAGIATDNMLGRFACSGHIVMARLTRTCH